MGQPDHSLAALRPLDEGELLEWEEAYVAVEAYLGSLRLRNRLLVADLVRMAPAVVDALRESGDLERILRAELEPFYTSPEVTALLDGA